MSARLHDTVIDDSFLRYCAPDSELNTRDVVKLFGFSNALSLYSLVKYGSFPKPDCYVAGISPTRPRLCQWKVSTIRKEIRRRRTANAT